MTTITATYENGVFKPDAPLAIPSGSRVEIVIPDDAASLSEEQIIEAMRRRYPGVVGCLSPGQADDLQRVIEEEFEQVNPDEWR